MKSHDLEFAEYLDACCGRYARSLPYRRRLELERPLPPPHPNTEHLYPRRLAPYPRRSA